MKEQRPSPDKLLDSVHKEESTKHQGKLKIYLGAAPGVGKTYEMLQDALENLSKGLDVVVGIVESHGRKEIEFMLQDFEIIPRKTISYHERKLSEFDIDSTLKRYPGLVLIDEMAHTNAPGARHKKRWQDIQEILNRGIDVYTTLNVQHIESLNDAVSQIINAPVKETVPDFMIEIANTIELVDIPPEDLLKRLREGKVYIPAQAELATEHFFQKGNLIALRELALRVTAERVSAESLLYRQGQGIKHIWPINEKILVCVGPGSETLKLIRGAKRTATNLQAEWIAVYVDTPKLQSREQIRNSAIQNLHFAEQLGANTRVLTGFDIVKELINFAHEQNVTQIMVWKHVYSRWRNFFKRNLADEIVRYSGEIDVYIMTGEHERKMTSPSPNLKQIKSTPWYAYGIAISSVFIATLVNFLLVPFLSHSNLMMIYVLAVTVVALFGETGPSILASILSVLAYDYFFIPPAYTLGLFTITNYEYLVTLFIMLLVTQIISHLTIMIRKQAEAARLNEYQTSALYTLSRQLAASRGVDKILQIGTDYISKLFNSDVLALVLVNEKLVIRPKEKDRNELVEKEQSIAQWVFDLGQPAGFGTDTLSFSDALYIPLLSSQGTVGVLRIHSRMKQLLTPEQMQLLSSCANQIALALEVDRLHNS